MEKSAAELAELLGGTVSGNPQVTVNALGKIESAVEGELTFLANDKYEKFLYESNASIVVVSETFSPKSTLPTDLTLIKVADPYSAFANLLETYNENLKRESGIHDSAIIHRDAIVSEGCSIGAGVIIDAGAVIGANTELRAAVYIGIEVEVGSGCLFYSGVRVLDRCKVGDNCTLQANTVVGSEGFGFAPKEDGTYAKVPQTGNVVIENNCDIGAMCAIDRATLGSTLIMKGCKLDNLIQVAHNVEIGEKTVIAAQTGIAGSTIIGANCLIGGQVGFAGHLKIADGTKIAAKAGISKHVKIPGTILQGIPATPIRTYQKFQVALRGLVRQYQANRES
jgi:UDP-3-O-[3-hydroxymyristoyl] glucosamine N-acyltransferase